MPHQQVDHIAEPGFDRVAVVGFGLVGASFAAAFRSAHPDARVLAVMNDGALARLFEPRTHLGMSERIVDNVLAKLAGH